MKFKLLLIPVLFLLVLSLVFFKKLKVEGSYKSPISKEYWDKMTEEEKQQYWEKVTYQ